MTTTATELPISKAKEEIVKEAKRIEESALHSAKGHFRAATLWGQFHITIGLPMVVLAAVAGASAFAKLDQDKSLAGILSIVVVVLSSVSTFLNPNKKSTDHLNAANKYDNLLNRVRIFRTIECWQETNDQALGEKLKRFSDDKAMLNQSSPQIPWLAYVMAKRGIKQGEADYEVDKPKP
ncbi:MAG TPA: SLATT domain-containing protein [Lacunisphaera sp.]|nr:SLATT domain-containing protein [Lacunisphaera sp.]